MKIILLSCVLYATVLNLAAQPSFRIGSNVINDKIAGTVKIFTIPGDTSEVKSADILEVNTWKKDIVTQKQSFVVAVKQGAIVSHNGRNISIDSATADLMTKLPCPACVGSTCCWNGYECVSDLVLGTGKECIAVKACKSK